MSLNSTSVINSSCPKSHSFQNVRETETKMCLQDRKNWNYETPMPNGTPILCFPQNLHYIPVFFTFLLLPGGGGIVFQTNHSTQRAIFQLTESL